MVENRNYFYQLIVFSAIGLFGVKMYVKGVGMTKFGVHAETTQELCYEAIIEALSDADMPITDIDEIIISKGDLIKLQKKLRR